MVKTARCQRCKKFYEYEGIPPQYCAECFIRDQEEYSIVREFVKEHPGVTITEVSNSLHVSSAKIIQYLREERLEISPRSVSFLKCKACGAVINTGLYCDKHRRSNSSSLNKMISKVQSTDDSKMHMLVEDAKKKAEGRKF